ncbi:hypothetical protein FF38_00383 [Lucilia cuprina]|uniref:Uncharacterized protein n=1 Tax=Lucilia cuprina TaxID=7375 RepID=A0A0L0CNH9_LUCCU|nr:hypothetical protein FF38_00383 [Lucilia cuprina]
MSDSFSTLNISLLQGPDLIVGIYYNFKQFSNFVTFYVLSDCFPIVARHMQILRVFTGWCGNEESLA